MLPETTKEQIHVLLVDDEEDEHVIVRDLLRSDHGQRFVLTSVSTYKAGLEAMLSSSFEVCLVDYQLGERNGLELVAEAKNKSSRAEIILLTGDGGVEVDRKAARAGAGDFLAKEGLTPAILERSLRYAVERGKATGNLRQLLDEKDLLLKEVHHRVKNNLQVICSLLSLQAGCAESPASTEALQKARNRVLSMSMIHEHLHESETLLAVDFGRYIQGLAISLFNAYCINADEVKFEFEGEAIQLPSDDAITCGLILNELVSNALKYAFGNNRAGKLRIVFHRLSPSEVQLEVADDGPGLPADFDPETAQSLGWRIVRTLLHQLGATLTLGAGPGTRVAFRWNVLAADSAQ